MTIQYKLSAYMTSQIYQISKRLDGKCLDLRPAIFNSTLLHMRRLGLISACDVIPH